MRRFAKRAAAGLAILLLAALFGADGRPRAAAQDDGADDLYKHLSIFTQVLSLLRRAYVEEPDLGSLFAGGMAGIADALDPFTHYVPPAGVDTFRQTRRIGRSRSGVAAVKERGIAYALTVEPGSPGARAGLRRGDILSKIDGASTRPMPLWQIHARLAGEPGSRVELESIRRGTARQATLELASYETPGVSREERRGVPIVRVGRFEAAAVDALGRQLEELKREGSARLILDLLGVAGGDAESAYAAGALFARGELGRLDRRGTTLRGFSASEAPRWTGRLLILTDRGTQGPAEILAAVLAQSAGAERIGERTFGHAGRAAVQELPDGALLILTDAFYTGPDGEILDRGLEPALRVSEASRRDGEAELPIEELIRERAVERALGAGSAAAAGGAP